jgi:hypothetical protein
MNFREVYRRHNGREATPAEVLKFEQIVKELDTTPSDSLLVILVAFEFYSTMYEEMPGKIREAALNVYAEFKKAADAQAKASMSKAKADMSAAVAEVAHKVAQDVAGAERDRAYTGKLRWACGCLLIASVGLSGAWRWGHNGGIQEGMGIGYQQAKDQVAAAAWGNTPEGRRAYKMALSGALEQVMRCDSPGWEVKNGACYVQAGKDDKIYGWLVP